jgi:hypothetical protein
MVMVCNSNDKILPNIDWEFRSRSDGLDCFKIYIYYIECKNKIVQKNLSLIRFVFQNYFIAIPERN